MRGSEDVNQRWTVRTGEWEAAMNENQEGLESYWIKVREYWADRRVTCDPQLCRLDNGI